MLLPTLSMVALMTQKPTKHAAVRAYLERVGFSELRIVAARTKLSEGDLREIITEDREISDEIAEAVTRIME